MITSRGTSPLTQYAAILRAAKSGGAIDPLELGAVLDSVGKTHEQFLTDMFRDRPAMPMSGDRCPVPGCDGRLRCYASRPKGSLQERRLSCSLCGGGKITAVVPADQVRRRR